MKKIILTCSLLSLLIYVQAGHAIAESMRCGSNLVSTGDSIAKVLLRCGEPFYKENSETIGNESSRTQGQISIVMGGGIYSESTNRASSDIKIEKLYYNLGEGQFIRILTFEGGNLIEVEEGDKP